MKWDSFKKTVTVIVLENIEVLRGNRTNRIMVYYVQVTIVFDNTEYMV